MRRVALLLLLVLPVGCDKQEEPQPEPTTVVQKPESSDHGNPFLGVPHDEERCYEDEVPDYDPSFDPRLKGQVTLTRVTEETYNRFLALRQQDRVRSEERRGDWLYYAVEVQRSVRLPAANGSPAMPVQIAVRQRYRTKVPGAQ
jgi:hypothetical protein